MHRSSSSSIEIVHETAGDVYGDEEMNGEEDEGEYNPALDRGNILNLVDDLLEKYSLGKSGYFVLKPT